LVRGKSIFGKGLETDENIHAWYFGRYVNRVPSWQGPVPAADVRECGFKSSWLSAWSYIQAPGPLPHLIDVWRSGAPAIDFLSADIYFQNFAEWARKFHRSGNPLFIPEAMPGPVDSVNALYAIGQHDAIGFSPFSIDSLDADTSSAITESYDLLTQLAPMVVAHQGKGTMAGLLPEGAEQRLPQQLRLGDYVLNVSFDRPTQSDYERTLWRTVIALGATNMFLPALV
jgi:hypothetical protein